MDLIKVKGVMSAKLIGPNGQVKDVREGEANLIVTAGKNGIADQLLASPTIAKPSHMGIGTGTTAPADAQTALVTEVGARAALVKSRSNNVLTMVGSFGAGNGTGAITEAGIFNAASGGNMFSRITFSAINKGSNDTLELTWTYTIG